MQIYDYKTIWKNKEVFSIVANRKELDKVDIDKIYNKFEKQSIHQEDLYGYDGVREKKLELKLYYHKIFANFKNKKLNL